MAFIPAFATYKKTAIPYFAALMQHILIGDFLTGGGIQLFWPTTQTWYGLEIPITSLTNIIIEWTSFIIAGATMFATKDIQKMLRSHKSNLLLSVPTATVLLPSFIHFPLVVPTPLLIPHLIYLVLFTISLLALFKSTLKGSKQLKTHVFSIIHQKTL
jgi:hypothetical protein